TGMLNADPLNESGSGLPPVFEKLAEKFDLDKDDVADFLEDFKEERKIEIQYQWQRILDSWRYT
ncbi:MAG: hypothetical protein LPJ98_11160, partial [Cyclobacteriaceae bacterium]|nr:hypothetical protein [Cyclobacteriaceae bacterium]